MNSREKTSIKKIKNPPHRVFIICTILFVIYVAFLKLSLDGKIILNTKEIPLQLLTPSLKVLTVEFQKDVLLSRFLEK